MRSVGPDGLPEPASDDEIGRLARTMNAMLERLDQSARRQRQLVSDASHELRSPVTAIRTDLEVALHEGDEADGPMRLLVDDDGPGVPPADRERIFERFTRLDDSRARDRGGAGLGLAVVRSVVTRHGGFVWAEQSPLGGARFTVELPAATVTS